MKPKTKRDAIERAAAIAVCLLAMLAFFLYFWTVGGTQP